MPKMSQKEKEHSRNAELKQKLTASKLTEESKDFISALIKANKKILLGFEVLENNPLSSSTSRSLTISKEASGDIFITLKIPHAVDRFKIDTTLSFQELHSKLRGMHALEEFTIYARNAAWAPPKKVSPSLSLIG